MDEKTMTGDAPTVEAELGTTADGTDLGAPPKKKKRKKAIVAAAAVLLLMILAVAALILYGALPHTCEVGENISLRTDSSPLFDIFCTYETDVSDIDTSVVGEYELKLKYFGFLTIESILNVCDTTPPKLTLRKLAIPADFEILPEDFIESAKDATALTYEFVTPPDTKKDGTVSLRVTDAGGNTVTLEGAYTISDMNLSRSFEYGATSELIKQAFKLDGLNLDNVDASVCGSYHAMLEDDDITQVFEIIIADTTPPSAIPHSYDILLGEVLDITDFANDIYDVSTVTARYETEPDFTKVGHQSVTVILEDAHANSTVYELGLNIYDLTPSIVIEAGIDSEEFAKAVGDTLGIESALLRVIDSFEPSHLGIGNYVTELVGEYSSIPLEVTVEDTTPPELTLRPLTVFTGNMPKITDFVTSCTDATSVSFKYLSEPDVSKAGSFIVTVVATDTAGNSAEFSTVLKVTQDDVPPTIYGVKSITAYEDETISYRSGVYAEDDKDGRVTVKVDTSRVNTSVPGTYYVTYTAADTDGNTAYATATVYIKAITTDEIYALADKVLERIITSSMTDVQKARAIYDWCTENLKYSTTTSHLMGYFAKASYSGFTRLHGNCYTYYAVASTLLTRAGITNIQIQRNNPENPHYWNLVKIDDSWYHFDTCPQPYPHKLEVFLLTDSQVKAFSLEGYYSFNSGAYPATP